MKLQDYFHEIEIYRVNEKKERHRVIADTEGGFKHSQTLEVAMWSGYFFVGKPPEVKKGDRCIMLLPTGEELDVWIDSCDDEVAYFSGSRR